MSLEIRTYSPEWHQVFITIKAELETCLQGIPIASIEHIGSTSVPRLAATPIIGIAIILDFEDFLTAHFALVEKAKFMYLGEIGKTNSHAFKDWHDPPRCNIHLCVTDTIVVRSHIALRETLQSNSMLQEEYIRLKLSAAGKNASVTDYAAMKRDFMQRTLQSSGSFGSEELDIISSAYTPEIIPGLQTERLELRESRMDDEHGVFELESNEDNVRYQDYPAKTREQAREDVIGTMRSACEVPRRVFELAVVCEDRLVGRVGAQIVRSVESSVSQGDLSESFQTLLHLDLWYSFLPSHQGRGLATEAMKALIGELRRRYARGKMELEIECDPRNTKSWKMAERLGFVRHSLKERDYECKGEWVDSLVYRKVI